MTRSVNGVCVPRFSRPGGIAHSVSRSMADSRSGRQVLVIIWYHIETSSSHGHTPLEKGTMNTRLHCFGGTPDQYNSLTYLHP
ncbi:hypothetical protein SCLCIDRAFT_1223136 [Scleroderma citrinum Foug A]|uniref:Uncharacterized protein n=1 Tax=Scleroderma citrinum Foug A TaxID=1036808 RepID=A0A0C2YU11_9AGAM|nr:hypothetical protein SCLCIDRAFT_1223136 [Scleroderma citrinum Foug A]